MNVTFKPNKLNGNIKLISSKSFLHRMIICACLAKGKTILKDVTLCDDTKNTLNILRQIFDIKINKNELEICGEIGRISLKSINIDESATTLRLLLPLLAYYSKEELTINLGERLAERGIEEYQKIYKNKKETINIVDRKVICNSFPIENFYTVSSEKSSQYASGLILLAATLNQDTTINIKNYKNSLGYVDLTIEVLKMFGANIKREGGNVFVMHNQKLLPQILSVPSDASFATNIAVMNKFGSNIGYIHPNLNKLDPDYSIYLDILSTEFPKNEINLENNPDSLLPLAFYAANQEFPVVFKGIKRLIYKESNRIESLINFLITLNVKVETTEDGKIIVYPSKIKTQNISTFNDHRFAILSIILSTIANKEFTVYDFESVSKSYPNILTDFEAIGLQYKIEKNIEKIDYKFDSKTTRIFASNSGVELLEKYSSKTNKKVLVYDPKIEDVFLNKIKDSLGNDLCVYSLSNNSEQNKSFKETEKFIHFLLENEITKKDIIFALGGGSVLDFVSFASSIYKRGIKYVSIPSTLLAMVDASIGGKNAVDIDDMKNMVGTYNNPTEIYVDFSILKTLPKKELKSGMAELIKIAAISNANLFFDIYDSEPYSKLERWIIEAIKLKIKFIEKDPYDENERKALNFGHTIGHAVELSSRLSHGEAVAVGMAKESTNKYLRDILLKYGFIIDFDVDLNKITHKLKNDKKNEFGYIKQVELENIGSYTLIDKKI